MEVIDALLNTGVMVLIVTTMFAAGLGTTADELLRAFRNVKLILLVLVVNLRPRAADRLGYGAGSSH